MQQRHLLAALAAAALTACGGGGDPQPAPIVATPSITFSGTAATGAAIAGGHVDIKCAAGTDGNSGTTTLADGSYTVTIAGAALPCVMRVTAGSADLYSLAAAGNGSVVRANITPFSHMVAAKTVGGNLAAFYTSFTVSDQAKLDSSTVASAITAVTAALSGTVDFAGQDPITGTFVIGDAFDQQLDAFKLALDRAEVTLDEVTQTVVASAGTPTPLPIQPGSTSCAGLRSGKYRVINPHEVGHDAAYVAHLITVDAAALTFTDDLDTTQTAIALTPDATTACQFTLPGDNGPATLLVSPSGLAIVHAANATAQTQVSLIVPEQAIALSELAGTWNNLVYERDSTVAAFAPASGTTTFGAAGDVVAGLNCTGVDTCTADAGPFSAFSVNPEGGFDHNGRERAFAFKTAGGALSMFLIDTVDGSVAVLSKQEALSLPVVGKVSSFWDFQVSGNGTASPIAHSVVTVLAVDATAQSFTRTRSSDGRVDGFAINQPRDGVRFRAAGTSPTTSGGTVNFAATIVMPLTGTGMTVNVSTAANQNFFGVTLSKP